MKTRTRGVVAGVVGLFGGALTHVLVQQCDCTPSWSHPLIVAATTAVLTTLLIWALPREHRVTSQAATEVQ
jgi:hypothetical protein